MTDPNRPDQGVAPTRDQAEPEMPLPVDPEEVEREDEVEEASDESFPASDPPSFTRSTAD